MIKNIKFFIFTLSLTPLARLLWLGLTDGMGANPVEFVIRSLGTWTLVLLLVTLAMTPLRLLIHQSWPLQMRRMLGLFAFFYASLHLLSYAGLDQWFDWSAIAKDIVKHPFVLVGFSAFLLLIPLAITSSNAMIKKLGRHWKTLHRIIYLIAVLGVVHFWWLVKRDIREPAIYAVVLMIIFGIRIAHKCWVGAVVHSVPGAAVYPNKDVINTNL
ncbi:sulfoxide reductase heme-binding subunit YedZ [mine drainage metagenome]|uniref:Sulfoxide reductase heme-binding subunit YedZ n=1 Tax=mine drainage metagenome TaxID=410659 RepID=A0A1J5QH00_9ZZZZ